MLILEQKFFQDCEDCPILNPVFIPAVTMDQQYIHEYADKCVTIKNPIATCLHYDACLRMKERSNLKNTHTL